MRIYSALYDQPYPFDKWYPESEFVHLSVGEEPWDSDGFLVLHGGSDIHPALYGRKDVLKETYRNGFGASPAIRDIEEKRMADWAIEHKMPIFGICRGAQMLCILAGGVLVQHVTGHTGADHAIKTIDGKVLFANSLHHQMLYPWKTKHELLAWAHPARSNCYMGLSDEEITKIPHIEGTSHVEPEAVWFPEIRGLGVQGHPEFLRISDDYADYCKSLIDEYVLHNSIS